MRSSGQAEQGAHQIVRSPCTPIPFPKSQFFPGSSGVKGLAPCCLLGFQRGYSLQLREYPLCFAVPPSALPARLRAKHVLFRKENHPCDKRRTSRGKTAAALAINAALSANFQKILPLLHKSGRQTPPCAPFSEALRKKRSRKGEPCRKTKRAPPRAAHP